MKDSQQYILFKSIELRHSPWLGMIEDPNRLEDGTHRSFVIEFNPNYDRLLMLIHFKYLYILQLELYYRYNSSRKNTIKKKYSQRKMRLHFDTTLELLTYLSSKNYKVDWLEIRFKNGWAIKYQMDSEFITNNTKERDQLLGKFITISGQGPIDISALEINQTNTLRTSGAIVEKSIF